MGEEEKDMNVLESRTGKKDDLKVLVSCAEYGRLLAIEARMAVLQDHIKEAEEKGETSYLEMADMKAIANIETRSYHEIEAR